MCPLERGLTVYIGHYQGPSVSSIERSHCIYRIIPRSQCVLYREVPLYNISMKTTLNVPIPKVKLDHPLVIHIIIIFLHHKEDKGAVKTYIT